MEVAIVKVRGRMNRFAGNVMGQLTAFGMVSIGGMRYTCRWIRFVLNRAKASNKKWGLIP